MAGPSQLEVIDLIPGKSTEADVAAKGGAAVGKGGFFFVLGGYSLACAPKYLSGVLSWFSCLTGEDYGSTDTTSDSYRVASNIEVHKVLLEGFTKKFGKPTTIKNDSVSNALGHEFNRNTVVWTDKKGNRLTIVSMLDKVGEGALVMKSAEQLKVDKEKEKKAEKMRNF